MSQLQLEKIFAPLEQYKSYYFMLDEKICLTDGDDLPRPEMTHAEYVRREVMSYLPAARTAFGDEVVAQELVEISLPVYEKVPLEDMYAFWSMSVCGYDDGGAKSASNVARKAAGKSSPDVAAKIGIKKFFGPILDLALTHEETKVFGVNKFFVSHACRMGHAATLFTYEDYLAYIDLSKKLLHAGIWDWSIEQNEIEWLRLSPVILRFGLRPVMEPMVDAMIALTDVPGSKEEKYHFSLLSKTIDHLVPYMLTLVEADGSTDAIGKTLMPIVEHVKALHTIGAFRKATYWWNHTEGEYFSSFNKKVRRIMEVGLKRMLQEMSREWTPRLIPDGEVVSAS